MLEVISLANRHASHVTKALLWHVGFVLVKLKAVLSDFVFGERVSSMRAGVRTLCPLTCHISKLSIARVHIW